MHAGIKALTVATAFSVSFSAGPATASEREGQTSAPGQPRKFSFIVIGDLPYNEDQGFGLRSIDTRINSDKSNPFVIHLGDFKAGGNSPCDYLGIEKHRRWISGIDAPVFYTPGDNDWTDCDRSSNHPATSSLDQLEKLREEFFDSLPDKTQPGWAAVRQTDMPENIMWSFDKVVFATVHTVGGNNGRKRQETCALGTHPDCDKTTALIAAADDRDKKNVDWIRSVFQRAEGQQARAVVIATQADVLDVNGRANACTSSKPVDCDGFAPIREAVIKRAKAFDKPVLLVHGDTPQYCWDREFGTPDAKGLWRLNSAGDYWLIDAVRITVDPNAQDMFQAEGLLSKLTPADCSVFQP